MKTQRVSMGLTELDILDVDYLKLAFRNKTRAGAVSNAIHLTRVIVEMAEEGELILRKKDGSTDRIIIPHTAKG